MKSLLAALLLMLPVAHGSAQATAVPRQVAAPAVRHATARNAGPAPAPGADSNPRAAGAVALAGRGSVLADVAAGAAGAVLPRASAVSSKEKTPAASRAAPNAGTESKSTSATPHRTASPPRPPVAGSHLAAADNNCITCHGESDLWEGDKRRLFIPRKGLADDVHWQQGVNCHDCHGGDPSSFDVPVAHSTEVAKGAKVLPFRSPLAEVKKVCGKCHASQWLALRKGVHAHAGQKDATGSGAVLGCTACHGEKAHGIVPVRDSRSPVFCENQVQTCGGCHEKHLKTYKTTMHGQGLFRSGLVVVAVCADCHGAHGVYYAADKRSTLFRKNVANTCGQCHRFIDGRLQKSVHGRDVHGRGVGRPGTTPKTVAEAKWKREPSCTDCHQGHQLLNPERGPFRLQLINRCGNCHPNLSSRYAMSTHGELTQLAYVPAAKCSDCHGGHDILPLDDPRSSLAAGAHRLATCKQCHTHATTNFANFDPHADYQDRVHYPLLHFVYYGLRAFLFILFGLFVIHSFLWFVRSFIYALQRGRHRTLVAGQYVLVRSEPVARTLYAVLFISFLGLLLTGLPLQYSNQKWAQGVARGMGGFGSTSVWHHVFGTLAIICCITYLARGIRTIIRRRQQQADWRTILFGPDSHLPNLRDVRDLVGMIRWFFGLGPRPGFERWTYWEKLDYWAAYLVALLVGISGLMLWYPNFFCTVLPGTALNVAKVVHGEVAILAASLLFLIHYYNTHFRPEKFPMDLSALTGLVSEEHLRKYRPEYVERLRREGKLDELRRAAPSRRRLWFVFLMGALAIAVGLCLLLVVLVAALGE